MDDVCYYTLQNINSKEWYQLLRKTRAPRLNSIFKNVVFLINNSHMSSILPVLHNGENTNLKKYNKESGDEVVHHTIGEWKERLSIYVNTNTYMYAQSNQLMEK